MRTHIFAVSIAVPLSLLACSKEKAGTPGGESPSAAPAAAQSPTGNAPAGPMGSATIKGTVKLTGAAPQNPTIDMSEEPKCKAHYPSTPRDPVVITGSGGGLANVFVYVKSGLPEGATYQPPAEDVVLDQEGCLYHPRVFGLMVNQKLKIKNDDPLLHNIKAKPTANRPFNISQPTSGMETERSFSASEVMVPFECNVHGWMKAYAGVLPHPFFATTGEDGSFSIGHLPPGTYTIEFWHEKFGTRTATVTVAGDETKTADQTFAAK
jgi:hypothetical protein